MTTDLDKNVSMQSILSKIGFLPNGDGGLHFDFGNCKLNAIQGMNRYLQDGYNFFGYYISDRSAGNIDFFLPLEVESYEQGIALLAYYLRNATFINKPDWLIEGLALSEHLPWEKEIRAYNENPKAIIEHEWFRVLVKKLRLLISVSKEEDVTRYSFKGNVLEVVCNNESLVISGLGKDWHRTATVKTKSLDSLPKRILNKSILVYIWEDNLHIGNRLYKLEPAL
jgi:hypothetical protein